MSAFLRVLGIVSVLGVCAGMGVVAERAGQSQTGGLLARTALPTTLPALARQGGVEDCGPAVMTFVLLAIGRDVTPAQIARLPGHPPVPWSLLDLERVATALGLESELVTLNRIRAPGWHILHLPMETIGGHFVAARRLSPGHIQVFDPARGQLHLIDVAKLNRVWKGHALRIVGESLPGFPEE